MSKQVAVAESGQELVSTVEQQRYAAIEKIAAECCTTNLAQMSQFSRAFQLARGIKQLRAMITPEMMKEVMELQGTALGFRTDKDKEKGYPVEVVREALIEATLRGAYPVGNEFNIIADRCYLTKEFFARKLREYPGLTDLRRKLSVPRLVGDKGAIVTASATWKQSGVACSLDEREIPIRVNTGMGADAILGKAQRKLDAAIYAQVTGSEVPEGEAEGDEYRAAAATNVTPSAEAAAAEKPAKGADALAAKVAKPQAVKPAVDIEAAIERANRAFDDAMDAGIDARKVLLGVVGQANLDGLDADQVERARAALAEALAGLVPPDNDSPGAAKEGPFD